MCTSFTENVVFMPCQLDPDLILECALKIQSYRDSSGEGVVEKSVETKATLLIEYLWANFAEFLSSRCSTPLFVVHFYLFP
jgi:hypothetical protein